MQARNDNNHQGDDALGYALRRLEVAENALNDARRALMDLERASQQFSEVAVAQPLAPQTRAPQPTLTPAAAVPPAPMPPVHQPPKRRAIGRDRPQSVSSQPTVQHKETSLIRAVAIGGGIITFLGVAFLVAIAISRGWLGPAGRVFLAYLVSLGLVAASYRYRVAAPPAALTALVVTATYAALATTHVVTAVLEWIPPNVAGMVMILLYGGVGYYSWKVFYTRVANTTAQWLALGAAAFALYTPLASEIPEHLTFTLLALLIAGFGLLHKDSILQIIATTTAGVALVITYVLDGQQFPLIVAIIVIVQTWGLAWAGSRFAGKQSSAVAVIAPVCLPLIAAVCDRHDWTQWLVVIALCGVFIMSCTCARSEDLRTATVGVMPIVVWATTVPVVPRTGSGGVIDGSYWSMGQLVVFFVLLLATMRFCTRAWVAAAWALSAIGITAGLGRTVLSLDVTWRTSDSLFVAITIWVVLLVAIAARPLWPTTRTVATELIGLLLGLYLSMLAIVGVGMHVGFLFGNADVGMLIAHALVSIGWMVLAARFLLGQDGRLSNLGALLALVAVLKLVFYDLSALSGIARAVAFLMSGLVLLMIAVRRSQVRRKVSDDAAARGQSDENEGVAVS